MTYEFVWRDGSVSRGDGTTPEDAFTKLGFGVGAVSALDYWRKVNEAESIKHSEGSS